MLYFKKVVKVNENERENEGLCFGPQKITKEVKEVNKKLGGRLSAVFTAVHSPLCVSLYPKHVHMSNTPDSFPEQQVQPPTSTPTAPPRFHSLEVGMPPEQKPPSPAGFPPLSQTHCGLSGAVKGSVLRPFTTAALNELVERLF